MKKIATLLALCIACAVGSSSACTLGLGPGFPDLVKSERSVFVFEIETLAVTGNGPPYQWAAGRMRVLRTLKGPPAQFRFFRIPIGACGLRMLVGEPYVVATSQDGKVFDLFPRGESILGLGRGYQPTASDEDNDRSRVLGEIRKILTSGRASEGFPSAQDRWLSPLASAPPPPPAAIPPKRR